MIKFLEFRLLFSIRAFCFYWVKILLMNYKEIFFAKHEYSCKWNWNFHKETLHWVSGQKKKTLHWEALAFSSNTSRYDMISQKYSTDCQANKTITNKDVPKVDCNSVPIIAKSIS